MSPDLQSSYIKSYQAEAKLWFDTVQDSKVQAYNTLYDKLLQISDPHIPNFATQTDRQF